VKQRGAYLVLGHPRGLQVLVERLDLAAVLVEQLIQVVERDRVALHELAHLHMEVARLKVLLPGGRLARRDGVLGLLRWRRG
jgi:hypothetical protein